MPMSACPESQKQAPAMPAAAILAIEIWFGVIDVAASQWVKVRAQPVSRLARGRRLDASAMSELAFPGPPERVVVECRIAGRDRQRHQDGCQDLRRSSQHM